MVRIRLRRMGAKKKPFYRVVIADKRSPRDGRFIETVGTYNPLTHPETVQFDHARIYHWLTVGAQPSDSVARLLKTYGLVDESGKAVAPAETPADEAPAVEAIAAAEPVAESAAAVEAEPIDAPVAEAETETETETEAEASAPDEAPEETETTAA